MAAWSDTTKHSTLSINSGKQYTTDDQVAVEALNNTVENAFYAVRVAENAQAATNNGVSYDAQTPTSAEQEQARTNIGAAQFSEYNYHNSLGAGVVITDCTTLEQIVTLAINNPTTALVGTIGNDPGTQPLRTLLGFPNGWGNYVGVISTSYQKLSTDEKVLELMAYSIYSNQTAKGYIYVYEDANRNPIYAWSGWFNEADMASKDASNLSSANKTSWANALNIERVYQVWSGSQVLSGGYLNVDLSPYKMVRIYYKCYQASGQNFGANGGVIELDPNHSPATATQTLCYTVYNTSTQKWEGFNTMGVGVIYDSTNHNLYPQMFFDHDGDGIMDEKVNDDQYKIYKIEGLV